MPSLQLLQTRKSFSSFTEWILVPRSHDITSSVRGDWQHYVTAATPPPAKPGSMIAALNQLLKKYRSCALEKYETQADWKPRLSTLTAGSSTSGLRALRAPA